jgi:predicted RND superfamily exporter protein
MGVKPPSDLDFAKAFVAAIERATQQADPGDLIVQRTGGYAFAEHSERVIRSDMIRSTFWAVVMLQVLFLIAYRHVASFPLSFVPIAAGIVVGFGLFAFYAARLTPVVAASGAILAGLGVDYCIHYLSHYHAARAQGLDALASSRQTLGTLSAMSAACVTSLLGFAAIGVSGVPALRDFAVVSTLGLGSIFIATWWLLPACLRLVDRKAKVDIAPIRIDAAPLMVLVSRHRIASLIGCLTIAATALVVLLTQGMVRVSPDLSSLSPMPNPPMQTQQRIARLFPSSDEPTPVYLEADSPEALWQLAATVDQRLVEVEADMRAADSDARLQMVSLASLLPNPAGIAQRQAALRAIDMARVEAAFRDAIDASIFDMQAYGGYVTFLRDTLNASKPPPGYDDLLRHPRVGELLLPLRAFEPRSSGEQQQYAAVTLLHVDGLADDRAARRAMWDRIDTALADVPGATLTGMELVAAGVQRTIRADVRTLLAVAGIAVIVWLFLVFRRPGRVLLTLVPCVFGVMLVLAVMRLLDQQLNVINLIALPMLAGVGVDDGIFLVSIFTRRQHDDEVAPLQHRQNLLRDFSTSTHAITMTSLTTALGFGSLMLTNTPAIQSLGLVLGVGMVGCWLGSVCLLAPILMLGRLPHREVAA